MMTAIIGLAAVACSVGYFLYPAEFFRLLMIVEEYALLNWDNLGVLFDECAQVAQEYAIQAHRWIMDLVDQARAAWS